jgi:hypothetical protein
MENDKNAQLLEELRDELRMQRQAREHHARRTVPWYERAPYKEIIAHSVTACVAVTIAMLVHQCTGAPVTIEAQSAPPTPPAVSTTATPQATTFAFAEPEATPSASVVATAPPLSTHTAKSKKPQPIPPAPAMAAPTTQDKE